MAKVHNVLKMWQGCHNLRAILKEHRAQNEQTTAIGYISNMEEIRKAPWPNFQHDGEAAFTLSERSPLPPALSPKDLAGGRTQILNVCRIRRFDLHPVESDEVSAPERLLDNNNLLSWNGT